jgi:hypothetical protein
MAKKKLPATKPPRPAGIPPIAIGIVVALLVVGGLALLVLRPTTPAAAPTAVARAPEATDACAGLPPFTSKMAGERAGSMALATDQQPKGLILMALDGSGFYQHDTWDDAGYLGAMALDGVGNVYVAPTPRQSLADNPLAGVTTLWRADSATGVMKPFVTLPGAASDRNPFGTLGLSYSCDLNLLYAGTVIGSAPTVERGGVAVIAPDGQIRGVALPNRDVMGVTVLRSGDGFLLLAGLARSPDVVAVPLDAQGLAVGPPTTVIDLTAGGATPSERARKLRLVNGELVVDLVPFNFSLQTSASGQTQVRKAGWVYDLFEHEWIVSRPAAGP